MVTNIDRSSMQELMESGATLLDVLPEREFGAQHIPGARNVPLKTLTADAVADLDPSHPIIVYCHDSI